MPKIVVGPGDDKLSRVGLAALFERYTADDKEIVISYLDRHVDLAAILLEAVDPIENVFGRRVALRLSLATDHDSRGDSQLVAGIMVDEPVASAGEKPARFNREWWNHNYDRAQGAVTIDIRFSS